MMRGFRAAPRHYRYYGRYLVLRTPLADAIRERAHAVFGAAIPVRACAKVNLRLTVQGRRADSYHLLSMLNVTVDLADELVLTFCEQGIDLESEPHDAAVGPVEQNLVVRVFQAFFEEFGLTEAPVGLRCRMTKRIPIGAGLGGGSSDAGAVLRVLVTTFGATLSAQLRLSYDEVLQRAMRAGLRCGADVPYAVRGGLALVRGIGERVDRLDSDGPWAGRLLLMSPRESVNTALFYKRFREKVPELPEQEQEDPVVMELLRQSGGKVPFARVAELVHNDFESCVVELAPSVGEGLRIARRFFPVGSGVTGSGSAFFSVVPDGAGDKVDELERELERLGVLVRRCGFELL